MADSKISALSAITSLAVADQLAVARAGASNSIRGDHMPGFELDYVQITGNVTITSTADGSSGGTAVIDGNSVTYDGSTRIKIEAFFPVLEFLNCVGRINLYDGTTDLGRLIVMGTSVTTETLDLAAYGARFLTPSNAAHTYHIRGWKSASGGTFIAGAGAGGSGTNMPAWYRITVA